MNSLAKYFTYHSPRFSLWRISIQIILVAVVAVLIFFSLIKIPCLRRLELRSYRFICYLRRKDSSPSLLPRYRLNYV